MKLALLTVALVVLSGCEKERGLNDTQRTEAINIARAEATDGNGPRNVKDRLDRIEARLEAAGIPD